MDTFEDADTQLSSAQAGGFKLSPGQRSSLINEAIKRLAETSEWIRAEIELGSTVAAQTIYDLPVNIVRMTTVRVGELRYPLASRDDLEDIRAGTRQLIEVPGTGGAVAERFTADGEKQFEIYPPPEEDGLAMSVAGSIFPTKTFSGTDLLPFPPKFRRAVVDYAKGIAYEDVDENPQAGAGYIARADAQAEQLRFLAKSRSRGSGPYKIPVAGHR